MKKGIWDYGFYIVIIIVVLSLCYYFGMNNYNTDILFLKNDHIILTIGESKKIEVESKDKKNNWTFLSADPSVAMISSDGVVTGISSGNTTIIVSSSLEGVTSKQCKVNVLPNNQSQYHFENKMLLLNVESSQSLKIQDGVEFSSSDENIAIVKENVIIGRQKGKAIISAKVNGKIINSLVVYVLENINSMYIDIPDSIKVKNDEIILKKGESFKVDVETIPHNIPLAFLEWISMDSQIVTASEGIIEGNKIGNTIVTVKTLNGIKTSFLVKVI